MNNQSVNPLKILEVRQLSSVEFVHDYVQFHFDDVTLTAYTPPYVRFRDVQLKFANQGYRDGLCERIGKRVVRASTAPEKAIEIVFDDASTISISLAVDDYKTPEAAVFHYKDQIVVW